MSPQSTLPRIRRTSRIQMGGSSKSKFGSRRSNELPEPSVQATEGWPVLFSVPISDDKVRLTSAGASAHNRGFVRDVVRFAQKAFVAKSIPCNHDIL